MIIDLCRCIFRERVLVSVGIYFQGAVIDLCGYVSRVRILIFVGIFSGSCYRSLWLYFQKAVIDLYDFQGAVIDLCGYICGHCRRVQHAGHDHSLRPARQLFRLTGTHTLLNELSSAYKETVS